MIHYDLDLFSNFTYLLDNETDGDQIRQQDDGRWTFGANAIHLQPVSLGGVDHALKIGAQSRADRANVTLSRSRVQITPGTLAAANATSPSRPMANQAPWIINVALDYDNETSGTRARVLYNIAGPRLITVGLKGIPDIYQQPRHLLDITAAQRVYEGLEVRASAKNLINDSIRQTHGTEDVDERTTNRFRIGTSFSIGASYRY